MAGSRSLGTLTVDIVAKTGGFTQGLDQAAREADTKMAALQQRAYNFGKGIGTAIKAAFVAVSAAAVATTAVMRDTINTFDDMSKGAQKMGTTTEQLSTLSYAAKLADVQIEDLEASTARLYKSMGMAQNPISQQAKLFDALGIKTLDSSGKMRNAVDVLKDFADVFQKSGGAPEVMAAGLTLFGRQFQTLIPLIKDGASGINELQGEAKNFGLQISTETGKQAEDFNDNLTRLQEIVKGIVYQLTTDLLPVLQMWSGETVDAAKKTKDFGDTVGALKGVFSAGVIAANLFTMAFAAIAMVVKDVTVVIAASVRNTGLAFSAMKDLAHGDFAAYKRDIGDMVNGTKTALDTFGDNWKNFAKSFTGDWQDIKNAANGFEVPKVPAPKTDPKQSKEDAAAAAKAWADEYRKKLQAALGNTNTTKPKTGSSIDAQASSMRALSDAVASIQVNTDATAQAYARYNKSLETLKEKGEAAVKAGNDVKKVEAEVAAGGVKAAQLLANELQKPINAAKEYAAGLNAQLDAYKHQLAAQNLSITMGSKEAHNQQELADAYFQSKQAISAFQLAHQLHPDAMTEQQYQTELKALQDYWGAYIAVTKTNQKKVEDLNSDWHNGVTRSIDDFMDKMRDAASQAADFTNSIIGGAADAFVEIGTRAKTAKEAIGDFIDDLYKEALRFVANKAIQALFDTLGAGSKQDAGTSPGWGNFFSNLVTVFGGGRAGGGPAMANTMYQVNERGSPEMLSVGGRDYLMMGSQSGYVHSNSAGSSSQQRGSTYINVAVQPTSSRRSAQQIAIEIARQQRTATARNS